MQSPQSRRERRGFRWRERTRRSVAKPPHLSLPPAHDAGMGVLSGFVVTLVDHKDFPTFGTGVWWAIVTLSTAGHRDVVPDGLLPDGARPEVRARRGADCAPCDVRGPTPDRSLLRRLVSASLTCPRLGVSARRRTR